MKIKKTSNSIINFTKSSHTYSYDYSSVYKCICSCNELYIGRTNRILI